MKPKNVTNDELAAMVQKGFAESKRQVDEQFVQVHHELGAIRKQLLGVVYRPEFDDLQERVHELENLLTVFKKKTA